MNVLSLCDGISCGQVALERAGILVDQYHSSEIAKMPLGMTMKNYPNTIQLGDIYKLRGSALQPFKNVDLLIAGTPCQDLSIYKVGTTGAKGLEGEKSNLFFEFDRIFTEIQPKYFLLENVPMEKEWQDIITSILGVEPITINSDLVSAALRKRLYWTNIPFKGMPADKGLLLKHIVEDAKNVPSKYWYDRPFIYNGDDCKVQATIEGKGWHRQMKEVYNLNSKCNTLLSDGDGGHRAKKIFQEGRCRKLMPLEYERLQTLEDNYTSGFSDSARYSAIGNAWTVDIIAHIFKGLQAEATLSDYYLKDGDDDNYTQQQTGF
jgi:site-specific DNA-cytosine methylase